jgi:hypothetical protein
MSSHVRISWGADGPDEGEIDQGSDKAGQSAGNLSGGFDLNPSGGDKAVIGKESGFRFREGLLMLEINGNTNLVEFSDHISQLEGKEISHSEILSLQINAFTALFANEPRHIDKSALCSLNGIIAIKQNPGMTTMGAAAGAD